MEKAEILEMAVQYMRTLVTGSSNNNSNENTNHTDTNSESSNQQYYNLAYRQCLSEFQNFLCVFPGIKDEFKATIMSYMTQRYLETLNTQAQQTIPENTKKSKSRYSPYSKTTPSKKMKMSADDNMMSILTNNEQNNSSACSTDSSACSPYLYHQASSKFGGSCSSLDSYNGANANQQPASPALSTTSEQMNNNESSRLSGSNSSSPSISACSSPVSSSKSGTKMDVNSLQFSSAKFLANNQALANAAFNFELYQNCFMKVWRPW